MPLLNKKIQELVIGRQLILESALDLFFSADDAIANFLVFLDGLHQSGSRFGHASHRTIDAAGYRNRIHICLGLLTFSCCVYGHLCETNGCRRIVLAHADLGHLRQGV